MRYQEYVGNGRVSDKSPEQIARDLQVIRDEMDRTLDELSSRLSVGQIVEHSLQRLREAGHGPNVFLQNLGVAVRDNPIPVLLLGAGVAGLAMSSRRETSTHEEEEHRQRPSRLRESSEHLHQRVHDWRERGKELADRGRGWAERGRGLSERAQHQASRTRHRVQDAGSQARARAEDIFTRQPLVLAGLGLAVGAALGAGLPVTRKEREVFGERRGELEHRARQAVHQGAQRAREEAHHASSRREHQERNNQKEATPAYEVRGKATPIQPEEYDPHH